MSPEKPSRNSVNSVNADSLETLVNSPTHASMTSLENVLISLMHEQQKTNELMLKFMQSKNSEQKSTTALETAKPVHISVSDLPKFCDTITPDQAFQYLGTSNVRDLTDNDRIIVRAFKFISFRNRFKKLTSLVPDSVRLQYLYCCLLGVAQERATTVQATTSDQLLEHLANWYASTDNPGVLEDIIREKLELSFPFQNESLSDYIFRYSQYFRFAKDVIPDFLVSESTCVRLFLQSLRPRSKLFIAMVNANARKLTTLDSVFNVARDCESNIKAIEAAERAAHNYNPRRDHSNDDSKSFNNRSNPSNSYGRQNKPTSDPHVNVNRISTLYAPLESGPIPREATVSSSIYTEDLPAGNPSSLSDASGLESPPISVITETVPPPYSDVQMGPK